MALPPELRLKIYGYVCHLDIDCTVLQNIEHYCSRGIKARLIQNPNANLAVDVPWTSLTLTCKTIPSELRSFMLEGSFLGNEHNRTYVLDLDVYNGSEEAIRKAVWRKVPCGPAHTQILEMNIVTATGEGPWTDGGPASLARAIYQMLNHTCHNGPRMIRRRPLAHHMQVKDLIINIDPGGIIKPPRSACNTDPQFNYALFVKAFQQISRAGLLFGYVGNIKVREIEKPEEEDIRVGNRPPAGVPGSWQVSIRKLALQSRALPTETPFQQNYGFYWGV